MFEETSGSTASVLIYVVVRPEFIADHVDPLLLVLYTPLLLPMAVMFYGESGQAQTAAGEAATARMGGAPSGTRREIEVPGRPVFIADQVAPLSTLLLIPLFVPAYTVVSVTGSTAKTAWPTLIYV